MFAASAVAALAVASTAYSIYNGQQQLKQQKSAAEEAKKNALKQQKLAEEDMNKQNQKKPDTQAILDAAVMASRGGAGGTMLTGPGGVDPASLTLGRSTLLGGGG